MAEIIGIAVGLASLGAGIYTAVDSADSRAQSLDLQRQALANQQHITVAELVKNSMDLSNVVDQTNSLFDVTKNSNNGIENKNTGPPDIVKLNENFTNEEAANLSASRVLMLGALAAGTFLFYKASKRK